ncbi:MAG: chemotaxis protein CheB [Deltaproteobacteria bacterium]|nr:chemotaxis protein CheB [Deltaproteobacteria bacterium]
MTQQEKSYKTIVIGVSAGGLEALSAILPALPQDFSMAVAVVQHMKEDGDNYLPEYLNRKCRLNVLEAKEKYSLKSGSVFIAPPGYHLLIERDSTLSLTVDPPVCYSRPSIDVLFETAADAYGQSLIGVVLTGANSDGSKGLKKIRKKGGLAIVQKPDTAEAQAMPSSAIEIAGADHILPLTGIGPFLKELGRIK